MSAKNMTYLSSLLILPVGYTLFYALHVWAQTHVGEHWLPRWDRLLLFVVVIMLERIFSYRYAVSQRAVLKRDIISNVVNLYLTTAVVAFLIPPLLVFLTEHMLGREHVFASAQLGPLWFQVVALLLVVSFSRYWIHRWQHTNEFMWSFHVYHHRITDVRASNAEVSNPIDFALRNVVVFFVLRVIGFEPLAVVMAAATNIIGTFSHCGGDVRAGFLNYIFVTPEVHRWHHSAQTPERHKYACNYGVEFSFWDVIFGTYHLPQKDGQTVQPEHLGHPGGLPDESNYLKILLAPLGLYRPLSWFKQVLRMPART